MIRKAMTYDIPAIRQMAEVAFPATYKDILSKEQTEYMMEMMYSESSLRHQMTVENNAFYICEGKGYRIVQIRGEDGDRRRSFPS